MYTYRDVTNVSARIEKIEGYSLIYDGNEFPKSTTYDERLAILDIPYNQGRISLDTDDLVEFYNGDGLGYVVGTDLDGVCYAVAMVAIRLGKRIGVKNGMLMFNEAFMAGGELIMNHGSTMTYLENGRVLETAGVSDKHPKLAYGEIDVIGGMYIHSVSPGGVLHSTPIPSECTLVSHADYVQVAARGGQVKYRILNNGITTPVSTKPPE